MFCGFNNSTKYFTDKKVKYITKGQDISWTWSWVHILMAANLFDILYYETMSPESCSYFFNKKNFFKSIQY